MAAVTICRDFGALENKIHHCFHFFPFYLSWSDGIRCHDLSFWMLRFKPAFHSSLSLSSTGSLVPLHFLPLEWYHLYIWEISISPSTLDSSLWFTQPSISHDALWGEVRWSRSVMSDSLQPVDYSPPTSSVHGILQARILELVAISFPRGSSRPRDLMQDYNGRRQREGSRDQVMEPALTSIPLIILCRNRKRP